MKKIYDGLPVHDYTTKFSVSIVYAILASIAMNFFYQPGNIYSSGLTGLAQILTTLSTKIVGFNVPVSITLYLLNVPLFFIAWKKIASFQVFNKLHFFSYYTWFTERKKEIPIIITEDSSNVYRNEKRTKS